MIRTIFFYGTIILSLIFTAPALLVVKYYDITKNQKKRADFIHKFTYKWAKFVIKLSGMKLKVFGQDNVPTNETVLFVGNHQSYFDIPLLMNGIDKPKGFIAKDELGSWPLISTWMKLIRCVFMDRKNLRKSAEAIVKGINILKDGYSMVIFPEGTRANGYDMLPFKAGSFKLALKSKVKIIPVTIDGSFKLLEATGKLNPCEVNLYFHEAIDTNSLSKEEIEELPSRVQEIIKSKFPR
ncbi:MAG: lysophospholipid acyltransferase family protein [Clostridium sp.]